MKNQTMQDQSWQTTTVVRVTSVVPAYGFGLGDVCPNTVALGADLFAVKPHAVAIKATPAMAHVRTGPQPWSPPVT